MRLPPAAGVVILQDARCFAPTPNPSPNMREGLRHYRFEVPLALWEKGCATTDLKSLSLYGRRAALLQI